MLLYVICHLYVICTALYTLRGGSRDVDAWHANGLYVEDRGLQVPMSLKHGPVTSSGKSAPGPDPRIRHRIQKDMFRPIRVDHTNCLQVTIKTREMTIVLFCTKLQIPLSHLQADLRLSSPISEPCNSTLRICPFSSSNLMSVKERELRVVVSPSRLRVTRKTESFPSRSPHFD